MPSVLAQSDLKRPRHPDEFAQRHLGPRPADVTRMLDVVKAPSLEALLDEAVPAQIRMAAPLQLPEPLNEREALARLSEMAAQNTQARNFIGLGYYGTHTPSVIQRNVFENPAWYTAYTPYQPEVSQGRLTLLLAYQQMVADLTGLPVANASLLDEATAAAEAMTLARRASKTQRSVFFVDADTHPQTIAVIKTRAEGVGIEVVVGDPMADLQADQVFAALFSYPTSTGAVRDLRPAIQALHAERALAVVATDLLALTLLEAPGTLGADVAIGSAQRFGVPLGYGGPHAAFIATTDAFKRSLPGRLIGVSVDRHGGLALRMALQTREQHIRRDKATSNICTAQVLLAMMAVLYAAYHGPDGLKAIAGHVNRLAGRFAAGLKAAGSQLLHDTWFDTLTVRVPNRARALFDNAAARGMNVRLIDDDRISVSFDETHDDRDVDDLLALFHASAPGIDGGIPQALQRTTNYLEHPYFHSFRSETEMMRWLRTLQEKDLALDRAMIPLGSCTMKLNSATEMQPVSFPGFANLHPFAPPTQALGYHQLFNDLETWLTEITGFAAVSLQPNAGSQGEYAGLMVIRAYHASRGDTGRDICLIPSSAHGTNPASAVMAGFRVVVIGCDEEGNIDLADLRAKIETHRDQIGALMVTYPSTHGVFEASITEIADLVHAAGGQVYMDGANLNALVGLAQPGQFGADVAHMNLHKTFCIPHGGGGPGMGPIGVVAHLAPFLPRHPLIDNGGGKASFGTVSAAPWGSPSILPISWAYIAMMGSKGLRDASAYAILAANYMAERLKDHFDVVYVGANGRVAHEFVVDVRPIKAATGITSEDVAKRLIDYGFHAPTMSWPVPETLMIEPTESEPLAELDRFCDAMIAIRQEIRAIEVGEADPENNLLRNAPHTLRDVLSANWAFPYDRQTAVWPAGEPLGGKYWPSVARVDNVYGDRNLVCSCPPLTAYQEAAE